MPERQPTFSEATRAPAHPGERWRAPFACDPTTSAGRLIAEAPSPSRTEFQRDRDRILHSTAFRRLTHKTQVFIHHEGDHFRTRLTHTLEVSQIARALARSLGLDEDLTETLALAHDLGHTPFGHTGEDVLDACLAGHGGFDHNVQTLRLVTSLERRYAAFDGLNLTAETIEGLAKHNGPLTDGTGRPIGQHRDGAVPAPILDLDRRRPLALHLQAPAEAQAAAIADDIAYDAHDIDDGLRAGILVSDELRAVPLLAEIGADIDARHPGLDASRRTHELTRSVITRLVEDVIAESTRRLEALRPGSPDDIRTAVGPVIAFSDPVAAADRAIKAFLFPKLYHHPRLLAVRDGAAAIVRDLHGRLSSDPALMPPFRPGDAGEPVRRAADYIAGMTDRFALQEHRRLFATTPDLRLG